LFVPVDKKRILLVGSGSILSAALVQLWHAHELTVAYSGVSPGIDPGAGLRALPLEQVLNGEERFDVVVIISAYIPSGSADESRLFEVNVKLTEALLATFRNAHVIYCSSISVYEPQDAAALTEASLVRPQTTYAISKLWGEKLVLQASDRHTVIRISSLAGKGMKQTTFIPRVIQQTRDHKEIVLFGDGTRLQNYISATDLARLIDGAVQQQASGILLGVGTQSYTNLEVAEEVRAQFPGTVIRFTGTDGSNGYTFDASHTYSATGYTPASNLNTLIKELLA
jgi:nucleoside-diphosphate-sugar epimerase